MNEYNDYVQRFFSRPPLEAYSKPIGPPSIGPSVPAQMTDPRLIRRAQGNTPNGRPPLEAYSKPINGRPPLEAYSKPIGPPSIGGGQPAAGNTEYGGESYPLEYGGTPYGGPDPIVALIQFLMNQSGRR